MAFCPKTALRPCFHSKDPPIDKYVHHHKENVYACFVDFHKAFDSVWHEGLFYKLLKTSIGGNLGNLMKSLSCNSTCSIKIGENKIQPFSYSRGVRQGCILSPLFFNLYLNNLPHLFENSYLTHLFFQIIKKKIRRWFSYSIKIENWITELFRCAFLVLWQMEKLKINPKKTKIIIFQKRPKKPFDIKFNIGSESIEIVQEYTYLGTRLTPTGNFTLALEHFKEKALHAFSSIWKQTIFDKLNPNTTFQIFATMIFPILSYNSEVWGM